jgi:xanthine dehydrogenase/oxidase
VYRSEGIAAYIDVKSIPELRSVVSKAPKYVIGANMTLTEAMELFNGVTDKGFEYMKQLGKHIDWIANVPVRNVRNKFYFLEAQVIFFIIFVQAGTLAGNLSIKKEHHEFPSDIFTTFDAAGAKLNISKYIAL